MIMHIRTLEVLRPLGVVEQLLARADISPQVCMHFGSETVQVRLSDVALNDTAYPHLSLVRQMDVEAVLAQALTDRGVHVERGTELVDLNQEAVATLLTPTGIEATAPAFVVGCDGADSTVRTRAGIGWRGGGYSREVVLADVDLDGMVDKDMAHVVVGRSGLVFLFRLGEQASWRLLATRPSTSPSRPPGQDGAQVPLDQVQKLVDDAHLSARITNVSWSSAVRLRQGLAEAYRKGRVFLAGDAGHVHSPAGGQGMNTGIQDAINLGWKLAYAVNGGQADPLLDSYEQERRPIARTVRALTNVVFWAESGRDPVSSFARAVIAPLGAPIVPTVLGRRRFIAEGVRLMSQLRINYRSSPLSMETTPRAPGRLRAGDRLPDDTVTAEEGPTQLHELIAQPAITVLLCRDSQELGECRNPRVRVHRLTTWPGAGMMTVRPDGYIGLRAATAEHQDLAKWLALVGVRA
jgi:2-polyprenyl-6-methoxyphenol hydroxylase-like FAD-dependent oxidoreductase